MKVEAFDFDLPGDFIAQRPARPRASARLLKVAGGLGEDGALASAELFNPETEMWSHAGEMARARYLHSAAVREDGRVLVAGGRADSYLYLATAEVFDPVSRGWTAGGRMSQARIWHTISTIDNNCAIAVGGYLEDANGGRFLDSAELFEPEVPLG